MDPVSQILMSVMNQVRPGALREAGLPELLCEEAVRAMPVTGVSIMLMNADGVPGVTAASGLHATEVKDLELTLGEGPTIAAFNEGRLVLQPDLAATGHARWPAFTPAAIEAGVRAIFSFPLQVGAIRLGVLDLYRSDPGGLDDPTLSEALRFVDAALILLLHVQATTQVPPTIEGDGIAAAFIASPVVHQATGMVSVQAGVGLAEALVLLRANAFAAERSILEVAADVVAREIRFDGTLREPPHPPQERGSDEP